MKRLSALLCLLLVLVLAFPAWAEDMPVIEWNRPTSTPVPTSKSHHVSILRSYAPGDTMTFGHYEQDADPSNGAEPIEWIVLDNDGDYVTLISKYGLDAKPYNTTYTSVTWETCTLRAWLNDDFLNEAFTASEQDRLKTVTVSNPYNSTYGTTGGNDTEDKVYLLSIDESKKFFSTNAERICMPTQTAVSNRAYTNSAGACRWWLRSPGYYQDYAALVNNGGRVRDGGGDVYVDGGVVRPVVVLRLS